MVNLIKSRACLPARLFAWSGSFGAALAAALALMAAASGNANAESNYSFDSTPGKLPKMAIPVHYAIELTPDLDRLTIAGSEVIDIELREPPRG